MVKNESLSSLKQAQKYLHQEQARHKSRQSAINTFDSLPLSERQSLFNSYRGSKGHHVCFIKEYDKLKIMGYL